jgi:ligand-binding sensor domain-containing protein
MLRLNAQLLPFHSYTTKDGLASNWVTAAIQDSYGYLWIGTNEGLSVYDGATFTNYTTLDGLTNNFITTLIESRQRPGTIWIATIQHGLTKYRGGKFTGIPIGATPLTNNVISLAEDENGVLWLGTSAGVFRVQDDSATVFLAEGKFARTVMLTSTPAGLIWMATTTALLVCNTKGQHVAQFDFFLKRNEFIDWIHTDREGDVWLGTSGARVMMFKDTTLVSVRLLPQRAYGTLLDSRGFAWFNTMEGVLKIKKAEFTNQSIVHYGIGRGMPEATTWSVLEDREGTMWFQTYNNGLVKLPDMSLQRFPAEAYTGAAVLDTLGHVWGVDKKGVWEVWRQNEDEWYSFHHTPHDMRADQPVGTLSFDRHSRLCLVRTDGFVELYTITPKGGAPSQIRLQKRLGIHDGSLRGSIVSLYIDRQNRLWCSIEGAGVLIVDLNSPYRQLAVLRSPADLPLGSVRRFFRIERVICGWGTTMVVLFSCPGQIGPGNL